MMMKVTVLIASIVVSAGAVFAQPASEPAQAPAAAQPAPPAAPPVSDARKACAEAMNADPTFAAAVVKTADEKAAKQRDDDTLAAHTEAVRRVQMNQAHVVWSYAAIWLVAAAFVIFLWRRQQALQKEIGQLRRDLEAAGGEAAT